MRLYHSVGSRSTRVLWLLEELGAPFDTTVLTLEERRGAEHVTRHPLGRVPVVDTGSGLLFESGAICLQLADLHAQAGLIGPLGSHERGLAYQWAFYNATEIEPGVVEVYRFRETEPARADAGRERFAAAAVAIERHLAGNEWMVGNAFSVADVLVGDGMRLGAWMELLGDFPGIQAYVARLQARPAFQRATAIA
jgi:glutathione S-transferase